MACSAAYLMPAAAHQIVDQATSSKLGGGRGTRVNHLLKNLAGPSARGICALSWKAASGRYLGSRIHPSRMGLVTSKHKAEQPRLASSYSQGVSQAVSKETAGHIFGKVSSRGQKLSTLHSQELQSKSRRVFDCHKFSGSVPSAFNTEQTQQYEVQNGDLETRALPTWYDPAWKAILTYIPVLFLMLVVSKRLTTELLVVTYVVMVLKLHQLALNFKDAESVPREPWLPPGWRNLYDPYTEKIFYRSGETGACQWDAPGRSFRSTIQSSKALEPMEALFPALLRRSNRVTTPASAVLLLASGALQVRGSHMYAL